MAALLRDALQPNLVQTLEGSPALVHGGPFANIAHGCNSRAWRRGSACKLADIVVTEAGFGADLGGEKFLDIKCRLAGLAPSCAVVVATMRALKMHGGVAKLGARPARTWRRCSAASPICVRHVENMHKFGLPVVVALNRFTGDTDAEIGAVAGGAGAAGHASLSVHAIGPTARPARRPGPGGGRAGRCGGRHGSAALSRRHAAGGKDRTIAREIYRAADIALPAAVARKLAG